MTTLGPRVVIAGTSSGVGKTTVATGLMAALRSRGTKVASAKVGPDFIDPGYHSVATGTPGSNLDPWMCGASVIGPLAARASESADILVIEGVMGLFDGAADGDVSSTADVARLLDAPVILVVDASAMSGSVAALVHGFSTLDSTVRVAGVVLNRVASDGHEVMLREALAPAGIPVVGALRRRPDLTWRDRHLGLVPVVEQRTAVEQAVAALADVVRQSCDLDAIERIAATAPARSEQSPPAARPSGRARIALAGGAAFSFTYPENVELLTQAGAEIVTFDPMTDRSLPEVDGLYVGGGFPEVFAPALAENRDMLDDVRRRVAGGLVVWAECGGLLWLSRSLDGHRLCDVVPTDAAMTDRLTLGYRTATFRVDTPLGAAGTVVRGHEFHYSSVAPTGDALELSGRFGSGLGGFGSPAMLASYLHVHLSGAPELAERLVTACSAEGYARSAAREAGGSPARARSL